jgi:hypothetical protein
MGASLQGPAPKAVPKAVPERLSPEGIGGPLPWAKWYPRNLLGDFVAYGLKLEEVGLYFVLLALQDANNGLPVDPREISACIPCRVNRHRLAKVLDLYFPVSEEGDCRRNIDFDQQRAQALLNHARASLGGQLTAAKRWGNTSGKRDSSANSLANSPASRRASSPASSPASSNQNQNKRKTQNHSSPLHPKKHSAGADDAPESGLRSEDNGKALPADEQSVVDHYRGVHPTRLRGPVSLKLLALLRKALEHYTPTELCQAIDGNAGSQFHRDGGYLGLELILRDSGKIDQFLALALKQATGTPPTGPPQLSDEPGEEFYGDTKEIPEGAAWTGL